MKNNNTKGILSCLQILSCQQPDFPSLIFSTTYSTTTTTTDIVKIDKMYTAMYRFGREEFKLSYSGRELKAI